MKPRGRRPVAHDLGAVRRQLTLLFIGTVLTIVAVLGGGLFLVLRRGVDADLDRSMAQTTTAVIRDARTGAASDSPGRVVSAREPGWLPDRRVQLFGATTLAALDTESLTWEQAAARRAMEDGVVRRRIEGSNEVERRLVATPFTLDDGRVMVVVVVADHLELEQRYGALIVAFAGAALVAVLLASLGALLLVRRATAPAEQAIQRLERFTADAAHELRTPLAVLRTRTEVALQQPREAEVYHQTLRAVHSDALRAGSVVDDLLMLARADAGEQVLRRVPLALDDLVLDAVESVRVLADAKRIELTIAQFEEAPVDGDPVLLGRLLAILLENAIRYTDANGRITVDVGVDGSEVRCSIADTGCGITEADLPRIFERFYRGTTPSVTDGEPAVPHGSGLGLAIARWIADAHDARIVVESSPGTGSTFMIVLPQRRSLTEG